MKLSMPIKFYVGRKWPFWICWESNSKAEERCYDNEKHECENFDKSVDFLIIAFTKKV